LQVIAAEFQFVINSVYPCPAWFVTKTTARLSSRCFVLYSLQQVSPVFPEVHLKNYSDAGRAVEAFPAGRRGM